MPEGPSMVILKELISPLVKGKKIISARGNASINMERLHGKKLVNIRTWGKQLLLCLPDCTVRVHFLLFGSYSVDEQTKPDRGLRLCLEFKTHRIYFYNCSVRIIEEDIDPLYDWEADVMSDIWNPVKARKKLKAHPKDVVCDMLLDQKIFSGVGNIIKNEVLYRIFLHPETKMRYIPPRKLSELIKEAREYSFDFLRWKKEYTLRKHWLAHTKKTCLRCDLPMTRKYCGKTNRRTFFCKNCQIKYG